MQYALDQHFEGLDCGFMVRRFQTEVLGLRGSELIVFAILYSFAISNQRKGVFSGSCSYLAEATGLSLSTVRRALTALVEKKLVIQGCHLRGLGKRTVVWRADLELCDQLKRSYMIQVTESLRRIESKKVDGVFPQVDKDDELYFIRDIKAYLREQEKNRLPEIQIIY